MPFNYRYGGKEGKVHQLTESRLSMVIRSESDVLPSHAALTPRAKAMINNITPILNVPHFGVQVFRAPSRQILGRAKGIFKREKEIKFAGDVLCDPRSGEPVIYTENAFIKFKQEVSESKRKKLFREYNLSVKRELSYADASYFVEAPEGTGRRIFTITSRFLNEPDVELCHPELLRKRSYRAAFPQQWHLRKTVIDRHTIEAHASVEAAWQQSEGMGIIIAVVDDGFDLGHEEFQGAGKIVAPRDVTRGTDDPSPGQGDRHGHACAGVACAAGNHGASGVAPKSTLMPIRLASELGSQDEAEAFVWAADHGADVISCSWGPEDGDPADPRDPRHRQLVPLPDSTRLAIDYAATKGRSGKGCVILWAAGNGNESVENDGYASYDKVIAVAACDDSSKKSFYSDFGNAIWCSFPSSAGVPSRTPGIWTTDLSGVPGYNDGNLKKGDAAGNYTSRFGGTSSATPGVAGVAALVLSKNPGLDRTQVRDILKRCCDQIDATRGEYSAATGRSKNYGYGRVNARKAVSLA